MDKGAFPNPLDEDHTSGWSLAWLILGVAALGCGLLLAAAIFFFQSDAKSLVDQYFPSPTPTATETPIPTPTNTPTPTRTPTPTLDFTATAIAGRATDMAIAYQATAASVVSEFRVVLADTFDSNNNNWYVESADDEYARTTYSIEDGIYRWDSTAHQGFIGWVTADTSLLGDFYMSLEASQVIGSNSAHYGVVFREYDNSNFYYFGINDKWQYTVLILYAEEWITLTDWTRTELINSSKPNRITVIGQGSRFIFFINDQYLAELTDDRIKTGSVGLAINIARPDQRAVFEFDNVELRAP